MQQTIINTKNSVMENNIKQVEALLENALDYGKSSLKLVKLKSVDKTADMVSSLIPHFIVIIIFILFILFISMGLAFWLGEVFGNFFYGFIVVGGFYGVTGLFIHFLMHKIIKRKICNNLVKQLLK